MAAPVYLPPAFDGFAQDFPRNGLPKGKAWSVVDYIPQTLGSPLEERGGWGYASAALTGVDASATYVLAAFEAPFTAGTQQLAIADDGKLIKIVGGTNTLIATAPGTTLQNPVMHRQTVIIPRDDGASLPAKYDGTTVSSIGAAPTCRYATTFVDRTVLASSTAAPTTINFSAAGDPTTWPGSSFNTSFSIKGVAALPSVLLAFGDRRTARLRGTTPPPGTDMSLDDPIFQYGTVDARSIAVQGSFATFANRQGVFLTDGTATPEELTKVCGISTYWRNLMSAYSASTWTVSCGWFGTIVVACVMNGSTLVDTIAMDTVSRMAYRISNLKTMALASGGSAGQELYAGSRVSPRMLTLSSMWTPGSSFKADADGTAVTGVWESPFYQLKNPGLQRWRFVYPDYDLRDAATDAPTMTLAYTESPEPGASYVTMSPTLPATTKRLMAKIPVAEKNNGFAFKITRTNAAALARLYGLAALVYPLERQL